MNFVLSVLKYYQNEVLTIPAEEEMGNLMNLYNQNKSICQWLAKDWGGSGTLAGIINHVKGATSLGGHTCPACNARHDIVLNQKKWFFIDLNTLCHFLTSGPLQGPGEQLGMVMWSIHVKSNLMGFFLDFRSRCTRQWSMFLYAHALLQINTKAVPHAWAYNMQHKYKGKVISPRL